MTAKMLEVKFEGSSEFADLMTVDAFLAGEDPDFTDVDPEAVDSMDVGDMLTFGGGAAPYVTVRRVS